MNKYKILLLLAAVFVFGFSCEDEDRPPIVTFDSAGKGAYPRLISQSDNLINLFDVAGSSYTYQVEFVDVEGGTLVAEYVVDLFYDDNDPSNGDNSVGPVEYLKLTQSDLTANSNGYQEAAPITITAQQAFAAAGVTEEQVSAGDNFRFVGRVVLSDGSIFAQSNSSTTIYGAAFRGHFNFVMPASCPSDLAGTYEYETTNVWCDGSSVSGSVDLVAQGGGVYSFSDWAFGAYGPCYNGGTASGNLNFTDVCLEVFFSGFTDSFGDTWTYNSSIDGENWTIAWDNTYGESATSVIKFPGGVPFTLK